METPEKKKRIMVVGSPDDVKVQKAIEKLIEEGFDVIVHGDEKKETLLELAKRENEARSLNDMTRFIDICSNPPLPDMRDFCYDELTKKKRKEVIVSIRTEPKIDRNKPCPCGSGKKYKKCCLK